MDIKIKWALGVFFGQALQGMGVDHCRSDIAVA